MRAVPVALMALALATAPSVAVAVNCKKACRKQIAKCVRQECRPPRLLGPREACIIGIRGAALYACGVSGPSACPKKRCIIDPNGDL
jgi:hypothetical protein